MRVAVIALCGLPFHDFFWGSYLRCSADFAHDLILVHRNGLGLPESIPESVIMENKIINGCDVPHKAFGAYRYYFNKHKDDYDIFVFVSDDVVLKRDGWLKDIVITLCKHDKIGFGASHIFSHRTYPHPNHIRAPFWWAKTEALESIEWEFSDDHDGEMKTGDLLANAGWIGVQVGNKINLGYDVLEHNHIIPVVEKTYSPETYPYGKINHDHFQLFIDSLINQHPDPFHLDEYKDKSLEVWCPDPRICSKHIFKELFVFDQLLYDGSVQTAKQYGLVRDLGYGIYILNCF